MTRSTGPAPPVPQVSRALRAIPLSASTELSVVSLSNQVMVSPVEP